MQPFEQAALDFIKRYGNLDSSHPPRFSAVSALDFLRHEWNDVDVLRTEHPHLVSEIDRTAAGMDPDEIYKEDFDKIDLPRTNIDYFEKQPLATIPDSEEFVLIDVGSETGERVTLPFAQAKPNVHVVMVDHLTPDAVLILATRSRCGGGFFKEPVMPLTAQQAMNELLQKNGFPNVQYVGKQVSYGDVNLGEDVDALCESRRVVVTGWKNPGGLGNIASDLALAYGAEQVYITNSGIEHVKPTSEHVMPLLSYLEGKLTKDEALGLCWGMYDNFPSDPDDKYDHRIQGEYLFASVLKLFFVLPQFTKLVEEGMDAEIFKLAPLNGFSEPYNSPGYGLKAVTPQPSG